MTLIRISSKLDDKNRITIPRGIRKELDIKPKDKLELMLGGINKARKLVVFKTKKRGHSR